MYHNTNLRYVCFDCNDSVTRTHTAGGNRTRWKERNTTTSFGMFVNVVVVFNFFKTAANGNISKLTREVSAKSDANEKVTFFEGLFTTS